MILRLLLSRAAAAIHAKPVHQIRPSLPFVIQKRAPLRLSLNFATGWNGVLKSWAVTRGRAIPGDKRLAVQVEDHQINES